MLLIRYEFFPRAMDVAFRQEELRSDDLVICRARFTGGMFDEVKNLPAGRRAQWSKVRLVLDGHVYARTASGGAVLGPGDLVVSRGWDDHRCRALDAHTDYLLVAWKNGARAGDRPYAGGPMQLRGIDRDLGPSAHARALAAAFARPRARDAVLGAASRLMAALAAFGLPLSPDATCAVSAGIGPQHHHFARALETTVFPLASRPMAVDLCRVLDLGARQTLRLSQEFFERFYVTACGWRQYVNGMRLELGTFLATHARATTESVSRALGFASPAALCHAFHNAGMASPQEVRRQLLNGV